MILVLRTDKVESEIGLYDDGTQLAYETWEAHRQLAETIHKKLQSLLERQDKTFQDISGVVVYKGPGSFTGLRIGISVANALAYSFAVPIVATTGDSWIEDGLRSLKSTEPGTCAVPEYGSVPHITQQKK